MKLSVTTILKQMKSPPSRNHFKFLLKSAVKKSRFAVSYFVEVLSNPNVYPDYHWFYRNPIGLGITSTLIYLEFWIFILLKKEIFDLSNAENIAFIVTSTTSPLALGWLVLGQQMHSQELAQNRESLNAQLDEFEKSVLQQTKLAETTKRATDISERYQRIYGSPSIFAEVVAQTKSRGQLVVNLNITNVGEVAYDLDIICASPLELVLIDSIAYVVPALPRNKSVGIKVTNVSFDSSIIKVSYTGNFGREAQHFEIRSVGDEIVIKRMALEGN